eukprot:9486208-Pyramimonas_sp.AAC.1
MTRRPSGEDGPAPLRAPQDMLLGMDGWDAALDAVHMAGSMAHGNTAHASTARSVAESVADSAAASAPEVTGGKGGEPVESDKDAKRRKKAEKDAAKKAETAKKLHDAEVAFLASIAELSQEEQEKKKEARALELQTDEAKKAMEKAFRDAQQKATGFGLTCE